jgi:DNA-binding LytR/AlgR family response regulator
MKRHDDIVLAALNASSDFSFILNKEMKIILFNQAAERAVKVLQNKEIAKGDHFLNYAYTANKELIKERFKRALQGEIVEAELEIKTTQNIPQWFLVRYFPVKDRLENVFAVSLNLTDITVKKEAELVLKLKDQVTNNKLRLPSSTGIQFLNIPDIIYCEADSNYTTFFLRDDSKIIASQTLKEFERLLSSNGFFRIHNSYLINIDAVKKYICGDGGKVVMTNNSLLNVSRKRKEAFLKLYTM